MREILVFTLGASIFALWGKLSHLGHEPKGLVFLFVVLVFIGLYIVARYIDSIIELIVRNKEATDREISKLEETIRKLKHKKVVV